MNTLSYVSRVEGRILLAFSFFPRVSAAPGRYPCKVSLRALSTSISFLLVALPDPAVAERVDCVDEAILELATVWLKIDRTLCLAVGIETEDPGVGKEVVGTDSEVVF